MNGINPLQGSTLSSPVAASNKTQKKLTFAGKAYNFFHMIAQVTKSFFNLTNYKISSIDIDNIPQEFKDKLKKFETSFTYPFSDEEKFRIEHGVKGDYFSFFKQLGKVHYYVARCKKDQVITKMVNGEQVTIHQKAGEIAAVGCGILRTLKTAHGKSIKAWYICDLKVGENYRGEHLPLMLIQKGAWRFFQCPRGYGICMNPSDGQPKAAEIWRNHGPIVNSNTKTLNLYTLSESQVKAHLGAMESKLREHKYLQPNEHLAFKTTKGDKDYQIFSTDIKQCHPWQLLHMHPSSSPVQSEPQKDYTHMISAVEGTPLDDAFKTLLHPSTSTAQVVSYGMESVDFNFLTSNQI